MIATGIVTAGIVTAGFWLYCLGMVFLGAAGAFAQQYRFAAADASEPAFRPRAISWVLAGACAHTIHARPPLAL